MEGSRLCQRNYQTLMKLNELSKQVLERSKSEFSSKKYLSSFEHNRAPWHNTTWHHGITAEFSKEVKEGVCKIILQTTLISSYITVMVYFL